MQLLETERLILRPHREDEVETLYRILVDELEGETFTFDDYQPELQFDASLAHQSLGQHFGRPSIFLKDPERYIGYCLLMPRLCTSDEVSCYRKPVSSSQSATIEAEIGWAISDRYRGQGYATEAAFALCTYAFSTLHLPRIVAFTDGDNVASQRVMQKIGMRLGQDPQSKTVVGVLEQ